MQPQCLLKGGFGMGWGGDSQKSREKRHEDVSGGRQGSKLLIEQEESEEMRQHK